MQLPSAAKLSGNKKPAFSHTSCKVCSTQPASTVTVRLPPSSVRTWFMRSRLSTTWVPEESGVEPTTMPVLPPWGTMLTPACAQALTTADTSGVLAGRTTANAWPRSRLRQSCSQALRSVAGSSCVSTWSEPTALRSWAIKSRCLVSLTKLPLGYQGFYWRHVVQGANERAWCRLQKESYTAKFLAWPSNCSAVCRSKRVQRLR